MYNIHYTYNMYYQFYFRARRGMCCRFYDYVVVFSKGIRFLWLSCKKLEVVSCLHLFIDWKSGTCGT